MCGITPAPATKPAHWLGTYCGTGNKEDHQLLYVYLSSDHPSKTPPFSTLSRALLMASVNTRSPGCVRRGRGNEHQSNTYGAASDSEVSRSTMARMDTACRGYGFKPAAMTFFFLPIVGDSCGYIAANTDMATAVVAAIAAAVATNCCGYCFLCDCCYFRGYCYCYCCGYCWCCGYCYLLWLLLLL